MLRALSDDGHSGAGGSMKIRRDCSRVFKCANGTYSLEVVFDLGTTDYRHAERVLSEFAELESSSTKERIVEILSGLDDAASIDILATVAADRMSTDPKDPF